MNTAEDMQHRPQLAYFSPPLQSHPPRQQMVLDHRLQQQQQHDLDRQRKHHEQLLLQEHHLQQQQKYARERQAPYTDRQVLPPVPHPTRGPSMPLHVEVPSHHQPQPQPPRPVPIPQLHTSGRKSDPGQSHRALHPDPITPLSAPPYPQQMPTADTTSQPNKRRRYSDSPAQMVSIDEKERIFREREKMAAGDLGYGRPEPTGAPGPRRPGSGHGHGRKHLLVELMTPNHEAVRVQSITSGVSVEGPRLEVPSEPESGPREIASREAGGRHGTSREGNSHEGVVREGYRQSRPQEAPPPSREGGPREGSSRDRQSLFSPPPHRRRSPPGSHSGRAIAAKKTEEVEHYLHDLLSQATEPPRVPEKERKSPLPEKEGKIAPHEKETKPMVLEKTTMPLEMGNRTALDKEVKTVVPEKETRKRPPSRATIDNATAIEPAPPKKQRTGPVPAASAPKPAEEDAHEWFLEHFDDYNVPAPSQPHSPHVPSPTVPPAPPGRHLQAPKTRTPTPATMPEAADELEQELEELLADPPHVSKVEPDTDMDVDLVTELVAETLDAEDTKAEDVGMEVDVEDELLSLLDDKPSVRRPAAKSVTPGLSNVKPLPPAGARHVSPSGMSVVSMPSPATLLPPVVRPSSTRPTSERGSMPPPASVAPGRGKDKEEKSTERGASAAAPATKKKDALSKAAKNKATAAVSAGTTLAKSRARPGPKPKPKASDASLSATAAKSKASKKPAASRSRSTSVMPSGSAGPEGSEAKAEKQEEEESDQEDDKLYCVCKTTYDEDRFMIACDRCDDWYHTQCVNMPDLEVDLVDQFICPPCIEKYPNLQLKTTYKTRCLYGLRHPDPSSPKACHRPARGAFSKYCSDECGLKYMQSRADAWAKKGGKKEKLWETVKDAEKREGVVVCAVGPNGKMVVDEGDHGVKPKKSKVEREIERLNGLLDSIVRLREDVKKEMEGVVWREKLLELATVRAEQIGECGWDQRLCFGDDESADLGARALESYDVNVQNGDNESGAWWCSGKKACDRHAGSASFSLQSGELLSDFWTQFSWQTVRVKDVCKEKEKKNDALSNLTTREREIRKRIEDILDPHGRNCNDSSDKSPLKASNAKLSNGHTKGKTNGDTTTTKKGKKRKAPS
ncbi:hypothetical protein DXG01_000181 [Tephrocybe rancida]|nr:hypothetical protein DXG01_000181 [Tephrocybe rancida]